MKMKRAKRTQNADNDYFRRNEEFLYASEMDFPQKAMAAKERRFGNSQSVRIF